MIIYHAFMDTDIDKWDTLNLEEPEKEEDEWWWNYTEHEVNSWYDFFQAFPDMDIFEDYDFMPALCKGSN